MEGSREWDTDSTSVVFTILADECVNHRGHRVTQGKSETAGGELFECGSPAASAPLVEKSEGPRLELLSGADKVRGSTGGMVSTGRDGHVRVGWTCTGRLGGYERDGPYLRRGRK